MSYDGTKLTMTITDAPVPANTFTTSWTVNISSTVGGNTAYAGFTAGTGGGTAQQEIITWTYTRGAP
jgi:Legume lectin domain